MRLLVVTGLLLLPAVASANAPGDFDGDDAGGATSAPGETEPAVNGPSSESSESSGSSGSSGLSSVPLETSPPDRPYRERDHRLSIGFNFGAMSLAPPGYSNASPTDFDITELALRYRPGDHLELEFALGGGRQKLDDGSKGDLAMGNGTLSVRYRFSPRTPWNWWVLAGVGRTIIAAHDSTESERDAAEKTHGTVGLGLERRFHHFAIQTELRYISIAGDSSSDSSSMTTAPSNNPPTKTPGGGTVLTDPGQSMTSTKLDGGQFTLGLSYYF
jgi:hypothetical protein